MQDLYIINRIKAPIPYALIVALIEPFKEPFEGTPKPYSNH